MHSKRITPVVHNNLAHFKTPRKCGIFGVCIEGSNTQLSYLIDEAHTCGKGVNSIVSMIHHYLQHFIHSEENIRLQADNCVGQNTMVGYLAWRVMVGLSRSCELSFMHQAIHGSVQIVSLD